tara:strand:- start:1024 stop:1362 length:339 start_codon:yes stop_codon:yes gene_type:complete
MTKQEFLNNTPFKIKGSGYNGSPTYKYFLYDSDAVWDNKDGEGQRNGMIVEQIRSSIDGRIIDSHYRLNVSSIGHVSINGFTHVMNKEVKVSIRFDEMLIHDNEVVMPDSIV